MLNCQEITQLVTDYIEGRLSFGKWIAFQMHIGMCRDCRRYLRQMRAATKTLSSLPPEPVPEDVKQELMKRFKNWKK